MNKTSAVYPKTNEFISRVVGVFKKFCIINIKTSINILLIPLKSIFKLKPRLKIVLNLRIM